jgi:hypothetical protein
LSGQPHRPASIQAESKAPPQERPRSEDIYQRSLTCVATREKREYLRNALLNIAKGIISDEIKQQFFLNAIEAFTPAHIKALNVIWRGGGLKIGWDENSISIMQRTYRAAIGILAPEVKGQTSLIGAILSDLTNRGFSNLSGADLAFPQGGTITNLGIEFLSFVLNPEDLPR